MTQGKQHAWWGVTLIAAALLMVTMGARQSLGLFVSPINTTTGLGIVTISFALGVGQFVWGAVQPIAGAFADRFGPGRVLATGIVILAIGTALTPLASGAARTHHHARAAGGGRIGREQFLGADRGGRQACAGRIARHCFRSHQRRGLVRSVRIRARCAEADLRDRAGWARCGRWRPSRWRPCRWHARCAASRRGPMRPPRPATTGCGTRCGALSAIAAICCCTPASSPAAFTSRSS